MVTGKGLDRVQLEIVNSIRDADIAFYVDYGNIVAKEAKIDEVGKKMIIRLNSVFPVLRALRLKINSGKTNILISQKSIVCK